MLGDLNSLLANYGMSVSPTAPPTDTIAMQVINDPGECDQYYGNDVIEKNRCLCDHFPDVALQQGIDCSPYTPIYWYHPDYIEEGAMEGSVNLSCERPDRRSVEFVSDRTGQPYQHFYYAPFGDPMVSQHVGTGSFNSDFRFNAKEFDEETGNYYYGARYYDPKVSLWMGVDALATSYPGMNPYNFVMGNPIMAMDLDGDTVVVKDRESFRDIKALVRTKYQDGLVWDEKTGEVNVDFSSIRSQFSSQKEYDRFVRRAYRTNGIRLVSKMAIDENRYGYLKHYSIIMHFQDKAQGRVIGEVRFKPGEIITIGKGSVNNNLYPQVGASKVPHSEGEHGFYPPEGYDAFLMLPPGTGYYMEGDYKLKLDRSSILYHELYLRTSGNGMPYNEAHPIAGGRGEMYQFIVE